MQTGLAAESKAGREVRRYVGLYGGRYVGRFAPSPTGPLHAGSLVAALASWLDARAHQGRWLVRIEDVDAPRCRPGAAELILSQLAACGLVPDAPPVYQSTRDAHYRSALESLLARSWAYACRCTRREIEAALLADAGERVRHAERIYPGTCRDAALPMASHSIRMLAAASTRRPLEPLHIDWIDRRLGPQQQDVTHQVGDFVLRRADGLWSYQLAVVVDDAAQGVTHVVRGADLADNTPRQIHLQRLLGIDPPIYLHTPLLLGPDGEKLSKRNGATAIDKNEPAAAIRQAAATLGLSVERVGLADTLAETLTDTLTHALAQWRERWMA